MKTNTQTVNIVVTPWIAMLFAFLKVIGAIHWSWLWVFSPIWIGWLIIASVLGFVFLVTMLATLGNRG